ncbi:PhoH family protein [Akkermansiaceae bacterium]|nr:PhoH family protein [Akkermansiaceae bacterium]
MSKSQTPNLPVKKSKDEIQLTEQQLEQFGLKSPKAVGKHYVLDTNVLLHEPACLSRFQENHLCIPADVLSEMDRFKNEQTERGANARKVHRQLTALFDTEEKVTSGVEIAGGGTVRLVIYDPSMCERSSSNLRRFHRVFPDRDCVDHRILACTLLLQEFVDPPVVLVTKDLNMQLKARAVGITCEDYLNDKVEVKDAAKNDMVRIEVDPSDLQRFASSGELELEEERIESLHINQYVFLQAGEKQTMPARLAPSGKFVRLVVPEVLRIPDGHHLKPLNMGQKCFIDALLNPDISIVTCYGQAGTGKTLVAMAAGLHGMFNRDYNGLTVSRPVVAMGESLGYLPGSLEEKMRPWLQPIYDALEFLMSSESQQGPRRKRANKTEEEVNKKPYADLIAQGVIEIEALAYIRGRSIPSRYFILDEAQQLTPKEAKTVVTRMSEGSKLVMVGDPAQIDHPYVDSRSNGLVYTRQKMRGQPFAAHITLSRGERSELAEAGARLM